MWLLLYIVSELIVLFSPASIFKFQKFFLRCDMIWSHSNWVTYPNIRMIIFSVHQSFLLLTPHIFNQVLIYICAIILMLQTSLLFISALLGWGLLNEPCYIFLHVVINDTCACHSSWVMDPEPGVNPAHIWLTELGNSPGSSAH